MIKLAFFDFAKTVAKGSALKCGAAIMDREGEFDRYFEDFISHKINEEEFAKSAVNLWKGFKVEDLKKIHTTMELNSNVVDVLKQLKDMQIKLALVSHIPLKFAELYRNLGFDYLFGNECEVKDNIFTGKILKINADKSIVVRNLAKELSINPNDCIAVGDSRSDIGMFKVVGYDNSFAYNANEEVKKHAKHHINDFNEIIPIIKNDN